MASSYILLSITSDSSRYTIEHVSFRQYAARYITMLSSIASVFGLAIFLPLTAAMPAEMDSVGARAPEFSFEDWANQIAANPDGDVLSPEEAATQVMANFAKSIILSNIIVCCAS
jgi:hypothetical protein